MLRFAKGFQPHQGPKVHCRDGCPLDMYITSRYFQQSQSQGSELSQQRRRDRGPVFTPVGRDSPRVSSSHVRACPFLSTRHLVMKRPMKRKACVLVCLCVCFMVGGSIPGLVRACGDTTVRRCAFCILHVGLHPPADYRKGCLNHTVIHVDVALQTCQPWVRRVSPASQILCLYPLQN